MNRVLPAILTAVLLATFCVRVSAQDEGEYGDDSKLNTNLAFMLTAPMNPMSKFVNVGGGFVGGAGYNISKRNAFVGEFMWNRLGASDSAIAPIQQALGTRDVSGHANFFAFTGNYRFELQGQRTGIYFIAGAGWYRRSANITTHVATGSSIQCNATWQWWGYLCTSGTVISDQTLASSTSDALGMNGGIGLTFKKADEPRYRFYMEARYHYAPTKNIKTVLIPITVGVRF
jgi:hypothetical protein